MKRFAYLAIAILVVVLGWTAAWFFIAGEARKAVASLALADGETNPQVICATLDVAGFPFRFDLTCAGATMVSGDLTANLSELRASILVYRPTHALVFAKSPLTLEDALTGSQSRIDWATLEASARLEGWRISRVSVEGKQFAWNSTLIGDRLLASATHLEAHLLDIPDQHDPEQGLAALAGYAHIDALNAPGFEIAAGDATLEAEVTGLPDDVRGFIEPDALVRWQQAGGALKLIGLKGADGDAFIESSGTLALDSSAKVEGQLDVKSKGLVERVGELLPENLRGLAFGSPQPDGSYSQQINIRAGIVFSGLMPVQVIPPVF